MRRTLADLMADAEAARRRSADPRRPVPQPAPGRSRGGRISPGLRAQAGCAGRARSRATASSAMIRALMGLPENRSKIISPSIAATTASTATCLRAVAEREPQMGHADRARASSTTSSEWLALTPIERAAALPGLRKVVLTEKGELRRSRRGRSRPSRITKRHAGRLAELIARAAARSERRAARRATSPPGFAPARRSRRAYTQAKRAAGVADFNDLIEWTRRLLAQAGHGRLGALQARPAGRPCAGRRGAGHQCRAMGDHRAAGRGISSAARAKPSSGSRTLFMVGDFKQAIYGFQGTDPRALPRGARGFQAPRRRAALATTCSARSATGVPRPVDRRELPLGAAGARRRRRGDRHGRARRRWRFDEPPPPHRAHHAGPRGLRSSCGSRSRSRSRSTTATRARSAGSSCAIANMPRHWPSAFGDGRGGAGAGLDQAAADAGRHPGAGPQPRRARLADRRAAVFGGRAGRRRRPAAPARAARGAGPARRGEVRGAAERRPQPRLPAGLAADRLGPGPAARARLRPQGVAVARACASARASLRDSA